VVTRKEKLLRGQMKDLGRTGRTITQSTLLLASADDAFLHVLVVIDAPQQQMERRNIKNPPRPRLSPAPEPVTQIT
jgi:hypothetical protein